MCLFYPPHILAIAAVNIACAYASVDATGSELLMLNLLIYFDYFLTNIHHISQYRLRLRLRRRHGVRIGNASIVVCIFVLI